MIAARARLGRPSRLSIVLRVGGAVLAVSGLAALGVVGPSGPARASAAAAPSAYNQMTGAGETSSAITVPWTQGLLNSSNQPLTDAAAESAGDLSPNGDRSSANPTSPLSFMYNDFRNLKVTVSQTQDITHQGLTVSWTGGVPSTVVESSTANFLQMMECYGDASTGPSPETCEYGTPLMLGSAATNLDIGLRSGSTCLFAQPSTTNPSPTLSGAPADEGCDPYEPGTEKPAHTGPCPGTDCSPTGTFFVPFIPEIHPDEPAYDTTAQSQYFNAYSTNEVQQAITSSNGTGTVQFQAVTNFESQGLGCGSQEADGSTEDCWLVIVPRGTYEPNGYQIAAEGNGVADAIDSSPLSASNWAQRIQVHLDYSPTTAYCSNPPAETLTSGNQMVGLAMQSWELALNLQAKCTRAFGYAAESEGELTAQLGTTGGPTGMGFTTIEVGTEGEEEPGGTAIPMPSMVYAPVAVTALGFGFNISSATGYDTTPVKLTPTLLAKALTQSYRTDLPDYDPNVGNNPGPAWSVGNPSNMTLDPEFEKLNPDVQPDVGTQSIAPLLIVDHAQMNQQVWGWIQSSPAAVSWLNGVTDKSDPVTLDPAYKSLDLGKAPPQNQFPRAYNGVLDLGNDAGTEEVRYTGDILPYEDNFDLTALAVLSATNPTVGTTWDPTATSPSGTPGYWDKSSPEPLGQQFVDGYVDSPSLADYGLIPASLCSGDGSDGTGTDCVSMTSASVAAALATAKPDKYGLLHVNPATVPAGAYPLVAVVYAAVLTDQSSTALNNYADLISFATGAGQVPGSAPGDLPPGYLPLTASLKQDAAVAVAKLRKLAGDTTSTGTPTPTGTQSSSTGTPSSGATTPAGGVFVEPRTSTSPSPNVSGSGLPSGVSIAPPTVQLAAGDTPGDDTGSVRWALIAVVIAGLVSAGGGILLRSGRWPVRRRRRAGGAGP